MFLSIAILVLHLAHIAHSDHHDCSQTAQCQNRTITCAEGEPCYVHCSGNWACRRSTIECPDDEECHIKCSYNETAYHHSRDYTSYLVCYNMTINGIHSSLLTVNASFGNLTEEKYIRTESEESSHRWSRTMDYSTIYCPHTDTSHRCQLSCDGNSLMRGLNINAIKGTLDLRIASKSYAAAWCLREVTLNCRHDYASSCALENQEPFECQDYANRAPVETCEFSEITAITTMIPITTSSISSTDILSTAQVTTESNTIWIDTSSSTDKEEEFRVSDSRSNGLSDELLLVVILIPLLCCACICIGFGVFMLKKNERDAHKHSPVNNYAEKEYIDDVEANGAAVKHMDDDEDDTVSDISTDDSSIKDIGVTTKMLAHNPEIYGKNRSVTTQTSAGSSSGDYSS